MDYTTQEYSEMILTYGECGRNARATARAYAERFPNRRHPNKDVILRLLHRARETGNLQVDRTETGGPRTVRVPKLEERVIDAMEDDPTLSLRKIAKMCNTTYSTAQRICSAQK